MTLPRYSLAPSCMVCHCLQPISQLVQPRETVALFFTAWKGSPKSRERRKTEHAVQQAFWGACLQPPFGLEGAHPSTADPFPEPELGSEKAEGSSRERELQTMEAGMRRQDTSVSSSERGGAGEVTAAPQGLAPAQREQG